MKIQRESGRECGLAKNSPGKNRLLFANEQSFCIEDFSRGGLGDSCLSLHSHQTDQGPSLEMRIQWNKIAEPIPPESSYLVAAFDIFVVAVASDIRQFSFNIDNIHWNDWRMTPGFPLQALCIHSALHRVSGWFWRPLEIEIPQNIVVGRVVIKGLAQKPKGRRFDSRGRRLSDK